MLRAVQHVWVGTGRNRERRTLSFRQLDVEQIGYVYEGLLSFEGYRAAEVVVGLVGKPGLEDEVPLTELEDIPADVRSPPRWPSATRRRASASVKALEKRLAPLDPAEREAARSVLGAVVGQKISLIERLLPFYGLLRTDLRDLPVVIMPGGAVRHRASALRRNTGTHYTPRKLAEEVVQHALRAAGLPRGPAADRRRVAVDAPVERRAAAAQGRRHRHGLGRVPRRRRALPRRGPGRPRGPAKGRSPGPCATTRCPATPTRTRWWSTPAGRSSSTASTASTSTRWPWRWRSCRCGWCRWTRSARSRSSTTGWWRATRCWASRRWSRSSTCASTRNRPASGGRARCRGRRTCGASWPRRRRPGGG